MADNLPVAKGRTDIDTGLDRLQLITRLGGMIARWFRNSSF
ncbi:MAG: hypothetical protein ACM3Q1_16395 [Bacteroidales bacterium]